MLGTSLVAFPENARSQVAAVLAVASAFAPYVVRMSI